MREFTITLADEKLKLSLSWKVMKEITDKVADPAALAAEAMKEAEASKNGTEYTPKIDFDTEKCVRIVAIASEWDEDDVGELFMENGIFQSQAEVGRYIAALLGADGDDDVDAPVKKKTKRKTKS